jgi:CHAD domain-containing protein
MRGILRGEARDWDVSCTETLETAAADGLAAASLQLLRRSAEAAREAAHRNVVAELGGSGFTATVLGLAVWVESPESHLGGAELSAPLKLVGRNQEARLERKVFRRGKKVRCQSQEELHGLRKALTKLRYGVQFMACSLSGMASHDRFLHDPARLPT